MPSQVDNHLVLIPPRLEDDDEILALDVVVSIHDEASKSRW